MHAPIDHSISQVECFPILVLKTHHPFKSTKRSPYKAA